MGLMTLVVQLLTLDLTLLDSRAFVGVPMVDRGFQVLQSPADLVVLNLGHLRKKPKVQKMHIEVNEKDKFASSDDIKVKKMKKSSFYLFCGVALPEQHVAALLRVIMVLILFRYHL